MAEALNFSGADDKTRTYDLMITKVRRLFFLDLACSSEPYFIYPFVDNGSKEIV